MRFGASLQREPHGCFAAKNVVRAIQKQMVRHRPAEPSLQPVDTRFTADQPGTGCAVAIDHVVTVDRNHLAHRLDDAFADERRLAAQLIEIISGGVDIFVESPEMDNVVAALSKLDNLEELYEVTGEFDIVTLFSASDIEEFRDILKNRVMKIKGVKSTVSSIVARAGQRRKVSTREIPQPILTGP